MLIGLGTAIGGLCEVPMMRSSSRLQRRFGLRLVYVAGCATYGMTFLLWGAVSNPTILSLLAVFEGIGFSLLFTTAVVVVGRLLPRSLYSTGNAVGQMVAFGIGPILGLILLYEIDQVTRFPEVGNFLSYSRLVRCEHSSAGKVQGLGESVTAPPANDGKKPEERLKESEDIFGRLMGDPAAGKVAARGRLERVA